jgi:hypothetical protein
VTKGLRVTPAFDSSTKTGFATPAEALVTPSKAPINVALSKPKRRVFLLDVFNSSSLFW